MSERFQKAVIHKNNRHNTNITKAFVAATSPGMSVFIIKALQHYP